LQIEKLAVNKFIQQEPENIEGRKLDKKDEKKRKQKIQEK